VVKIGAKVIAHARYTVFQMAEVAVPRDLFRRILAIIDELRPTDGRGAPNISRHGRKRRCRAAVTGGRGRFRQETGLLMLFRDGPQGYPLSRARQSPLDLGNAGLGRLVEPPCCVCPGQRQTLANRAKEGVGRVKGGPVGGDARGRSAPPVS
jgi:hypothetical protein